MLPLYRRCLRPLLFRLDPESVHHGVGLLCRAAAAFPPSAAILRRWSEVRSERLASEVLGSRFPNPLGMAAGFDKTGALYPFLSIAGFGFVESGTFTRLAQSGNPKPRLFRFAAQEALVNRMGFNNPGASAAAARFVGRRKNVPLGISVGKSRVAPLEDAAADQAETIAELARFADYLAVNVSSPNTPGLRDLQEEGRLREIIAAARAAQKQGDADGQPSWWLRPTSKTLISTAPCAPRRSRGGRLHPHQHDTAPRGRPLGAPGSRRAVGPGAPAAQHGTDPARVSPGRGQAPDHRRRHRIESMRWRRSTPAQPGSALHRIRSRVEPAARDQSQDRRRMRRLGCMVGETCRHGERAMKE